MWKYDETQEFVKSSESIGLSLKVRDSVKSWAETVVRVQTNKTTCLYRTPRNKFELWVARIPDPDSNKGSSGGFRLFYFFNIPECLVFVDLIESRSEMGFKKEHPRDKQRMTAYVNSMKKYLESQDC